MEDGFQLIFFCHIFLHVFLGVCRILLMLTLTLMFVTDIFFFWAFLF